MAKKGITAAGNWIVDKVKLIDDFPPQDGLCNILETTSANGGAPYNVLKALSRLGAKFPLKGIGVVGEDGDGDFILMDCEKHGIESSSMVRTSDTTTSYTDVMTSAKTGRRTFFHARGANALLDIDHFNPGRLSCRIFHLGYLLLLDKLDDFADEQQTHASILLQKIRDNGVLTSVDIVSENSERFSKIVPASLPHIDFLFLNEYEAARITGLPTIDEEGKLDINNTISTAQKLLDMGVNAYVFLHFTEGAIAVSKSREVWRQGKVNLPKDAIKGASGAGDAFAAGVLYALHEQKTIPDALLLGVSTAAASLLHPSCSESILPLEECLALGRKFGFAEMVNA